MRTLDQLQHPQFSNKPQRTRRLDGNYPPVVMVADTNQIAMTKHRDVHIARRFRARECRFCGVAVRLDNVSDDTISLRGGNVAHRGCVLDESGEQPDGRASGWRIMQWSAAVP